MEIKIAKFELFPTEGEPTHQAVGFRIITNNDMSFYRKALLSLEDTEGLTDIQILNLAWDEVKVEALAKVAELELISEFIGTVFTPNP